MLILFLVLCLLFIAGAVITAFIENNSRHNLDAIGGFFILMAVIAGIAFLITGLFCLVSYDPGIDEKIAMYQEENAAIETEIAAIVETYITYEKDFYADIKTESPIIMVSLYPELASDELVSAQINTYVSNNQQIKSLKEQQIDQDYVKWWINFNK